MDLFLKNRLSFNVIFEEKNIDITYGGCGNLSKLLLKKDWSEDMRPMAHVTHYKLV